MKKIFSFGILKRKKKNERIFFKKNLKNMKERMLFKFQII